MPAFNGNLAKAYFSGAWRDWNAVQGNLSGTWRLASDVFVKQGGEWKKVWVRLTAPTGRSPSISHVTATISWTSGVGQEGFKLYRNGVFVKDIVSTVSNTIVTTTDVVPAMQTNYAYTVSAYAGVTETAQISCGTVRAEVGSTSLTVTINTDWAYVNNDWNGSAITFNLITTAIPNATSYDYLLDGIPYGNYGTNVGIVIGFLENVTTSVTWRARIIYNGVTYYGPVSNAVTIYSGKPLKRNAAQNVDYAKTVRFDQTIGETVDFGAFGTVVDSYQFRSVNAVGSSLLANSNRRVTFRRPAGAGGDIVIPYGASPTSGTSDDGGAYVQGPFTNYVAGFYGLSTFGSWSVASEPYVTYTLRFTVRSISQVNVAYSIT